MKWAVQCPSCGKWQGYNPQSNAHVERKTHVCVSCNKSFLFIKSVRKVLESEATRSDYIQRMNLKRAKGSFELCAEDMEFRRYTR